MISPMGLAVRWCRSGERDAYQRGDLAGDQERRGIFQQLLLLLNGISTALRETHTCWGKGEREKQREKEGKKGGKKSKKDRKNSEAQEASKRLWIFPKDQFRGQEPTHTWGEDVWVEADVKRSVTDRAYSFAGIEDNLTAFGVCRETQKIQHGRFFKGLSYTTPQT